MAEKKFNLQIISPTRVFFDGDIDMVEMKTTEGEIGKNHKRQGNDPCRILRVA